MNKFLKLTQKISPESDFIHNGDLKTKIRENAVNDLENLGSDLKHFNSVVQSVKRNYQAILAENKKLKSTLMSLVNECYCWPGNRCDRCQKILNSIVDESTTEHPQNSVTEHQEIIAQLRKRKTGT